MPATARERKPTARVRKAGAGATSANLAPVKEDTRVRQYQRRVDQPGSGDDIDLQTVGGRIAWARIREDVTQESVAKAVGKVRPTIVQYESSRITPPIDIIEKLAKFLKVSPSFLAFGEHGIQTQGNAGEDVVNVDQITFGRDGSYNSGVFLLPRDLAESYVENLRSLKAYVMSHHAPHFNLRAGDRVFADTSINVISNQHDTYLLDTGSGMEIVRVPPSLTKSVSVDLVGPNGETLTAKVKDLNIIGAVVSTLKSS